MNWARGVALLVIVVMSGLMANIILNDGFDHGVGMDTFNAGASNPWQLFINNDLVTGLFFAVAWIIFRQRGARVIDTVAWIWLTMWWGNIVVAAYVLVAAHQSHGDWRRFFGGRRADDPLRPIWVSSPIWLRGLCLIGAIGCAIWLAMALSGVGFSGIAAFGYVMGFTPVILGLILLAFPAKRSGFTNAG